MNYDKIYNSPSSCKKVDNSWGRYMTPTNKADQTKERYEYSIGHLYGNVLDVGAGDGFGAYLMQQNRGIDSITCVEIQDKALEQLHKNVSGVEVIKSSIEDLDIGQFDSVHCGHTLEHVEDLSKALSNIKKHAKDKVVISVPINGGVSHSHLREFKSVDEIGEILEMYFYVSSYNIFRKNDTVSSVVFIAYNLI